MGTLTVKDLWGFAIILLVVGVLFVVKQISVNLNLGTRSVASVTQEASEAVAAPPAQAVQAPAAPAAATPIPYTALPPAPLNAFRASVFSCFGSTPDFYTLTASDDLPSFMGNLASQEIDHEQRIVENFRYRLDDGREERLELLYDNNEANVEMRVYGLDLQGQSVVLPLPPGDALNPPESVLQSYLSRGTPVMHQVHRRVIYQSGLVANFNEVNNRLRELTIETPEGLFYCQGTNCNCRQ